MKTEGERSHALPLSYPPCSFILSGMPFDTMLTRLLRVFALQKLQKTFEKLSFETLN